MGGGCRLAPTLGGCAEPAPALRSDPPHRSAPLRARALASAQAGLWICCTLLDSLERGRGTARERPGNGGSQSSQEVHRGVQAADRAALSGRQAQGRADGGIRPGSSTLSRKGNPYDNAVIESANRILKKGLIYQWAFADLGQLRRELNSYVRWYNEERMHSTLGCMSPVEFRNAGLSL